MGAPTALAAVAVISPPSGDCPSIGDRLRNRQSVATQLSLDTAPLSEIVRAYGVVTQAAARAAMSGTLCLSLTRDRLPAAAISGPALVDEALGDGLAFGFVGDDQPRA
jgi:hypothetical protein